MVAWGAGNGIAFGRTPAEVVSIVTLGGKGNKVSYAMSCVLLLDVAMLALACNSLQ